jgi:hypothetical protein
MNYFIAVLTRNRAKNDIDRIAADMGFRSLMPRPKKKDAVTRFFVKLLGVARILITLKRGDVLFLQYPMKKFYATACLFAHWKGAKVVALIHDLGAFRRRKLTPEQENRRLARTDFLIALNDTMIAYLKRKGCQVQLYSVGILDYLSDATPATYPTPHQPWKVVYAGGLGRWRNEFLYKIDPIIEGWKLDIYGRGFEESYAVDWKHTRYHGYKDSELFIAQTEADFGLVWDGDSIDECRGAWGEYLKINNPYKASFYLRSHIPVIVWAQSAMAPFVREQNIGICVDTLADVNQVLRQLTSEQYHAMKQNAIQIGTRLGEGYFVKQAISAGLAYSASNRPS